MINQDVNTGHREVFRLPAAWSARDLPRGLPGDLEEPDDDRSASGRFHAPDSPTCQSNLPHLFLAVEAWLERRQHRALLALNAHAPFWDLVDDILNATLFLLIGLVLLVLPVDQALLWPLVVTVPLVFAGRLVAVTLGVSLLRPWCDFPKGTIAILTWGGVRGSISIALALSLPPSEAKPLILAATYLVVIQTLLVQGLTLERLVRRVDGAVDPRLEH